MIVIINRQFYLNIYRESKYIAFKNVNCKVKAGRVPFFSGGSRILGC